MIYFCHSDSYERSDDSLPEGGAFSSNFKSLEFIIGIQGSFYTYITRIKKTPLLVRKGGAAHTRLLQCHTLRKPLLVISLLYLYISKETYVNGTNSFTNPRV